jgi:hypothetical protein
MEAYGRAAQALQQQQQAMPGDGIELTQVTPSAPPYSSLPAATPAYVAPASSTGKSTKSTAEGSLVDKTDCLVKVRKIDLLKFD